MNSLRFSPPPQWNNMFGNRYFIGFTNLLHDLFITFQNQQNLKILEIGSYKGETTMMFASLGIFEEIHCIDPFSGEEEANHILGEDWESVKEEFQNNTRYFNNIIHHHNYSYNIANKFPDKYFDLIYIDANHEYQAVKKDLELYIPKTKLLIGGHDYQFEWPGVVQAVNETVGEPDRTYIDDSWIKVIK